MVSHSTLYRLSKSRFRGALYRAQLGICPYCGQRLKNLLKPNIDHVVPRHLGGTDRGNRVLSHQLCNERKANRAPTACELLFLEAVNLRLEADLRHPIRWTPQRKRKALSDIATGKIDRATFMREHEISEEEMQEWERPGRNQLYATRANHGQEIKEIA